MTTAVAPQASTRPAIAAILLISTAATAFLFWLIYFHPALDVTGKQLAFLPALDAVLNGFAAIALVIGYRLIRSHNIRAHRTAMITAYTVLATPRNHGARLTGIMTTAKNSASATVDHPSG